MKTPARKRVGLALGGGAARGLAHLGVLTVLEQAQIPIDCVAGTSVGSLVGAAYCAGLKIPQMLELASQVRWRRLASLTWPSQGFVSFAKLERWLVELLGDLNFADLKIPFTAVATDLATGQPIYLREGRLAAAVRASCSMPGIVSPVKREGRLLVDGFVSDNLPVQAVRACCADTGPCYIIGVDVCRPAQRRGWGPLGVGFASLEIMARQAGDGLNTVDCLISPELAGFSYVRLSQRDELIARGVEAAEKALPTLRTALSADAPH